MRVHSIGAPDAPALVLIHGLSSSHRGWSKNLVGLGAGRRLVVVDLFDRSAGPRFQLADQAASLADALAGEPHPVAVIGHSLGGLVAMELAAGWPPLVDRLVLVDVPALRPVASLPQRLRSLVRPGTLADARSVALVTATVIAANPIQLMAATALSTRSHLPETAAAIRQPTLLIWGRNDSIVPLEIGERLARLMPNARLTVIAGAAHQPHWETPDAFHAAVSAFLSES